MYFFVPPIILLLFSPYCNFKHVYVYDNIDKEVGKNDKLQERNNPKEIFSRHNETILTTHELHYHIVINESRQISRSDKSRWLTNKTTTTSILPAINDESKSVPNKTRKRRYNYEDKVDWNYDDEEVDYEDEKKETNSVWKKLALNWEKVALRVIFATCFVIVIICICCVCCRKLFQRTFEGCIYCCEACWDKILGRDRIYRRVQEFCDNFGIKMDYATYKEITDDLNELLMEHGLDITKLQ